MNAGCGERLGRLDRDLEADGRDDAIRGIHGGGVRICRDGEVDRDRLAAGRHRDGRGRQEQIGADTDDHEGERGHRDRGEDRRPDVEPREAASLPGLVQVDRRSDDHRRRTRFGPRPRARSRRRPGRRGGRRDGHPRRLIGRRADRRDGLGLGEGRGRRRHRRSRERRRPGRGSASDDGVVRGLVRRRFVGASILRWRGLATALIRILVLADRAEDRQPGRRRQCARRRVAGDDRQPSVRDESLAGQEAEVHPRGGDPGAVRDDESDTGRRRRADPLRRRRDLVVDVEVDDARCHALEA